MLMMLEGITVDDLTNDQEKVTDVTFKYLENIRSIRKALVSTREN